MLSTGRFSCYHGRDHGNFEAFNRPSPLGYTVANVRAALYHGRITLSGNLLV